MTYELETINRFSARQETRCFSCVEKRCDECNSWVAYQQIRILILAGAATEDISIT